MIDDLTKRLTEAAEKMLRGTKPTLPFDPFAIARATGDFAMGLAMRPQDLMQVQAEAAKQWGDYWMGAMSGQAGDKPRDRRFASAEWQDDAYYRGVRDAYLLASQQLRDVVSMGDGPDSGKATMRFLLDQYLGAVSPANFAPPTPMWWAATKHNACPPLSTPWC